MSTDYRPIPDIQFAQLFDGRLEKYGIKEELVAKPRDGERYLVGCDGFLQANQQEDGNCTFTRRGFVPWAVFDALTEEFEIELVSEHDHRYWGFDTQEEWDRFNEKLEKEDEGNFYNDLLHYVCGEPNGIWPGTIGMIKAEIAKTLVESDPGLMAPEKRDALLEAVKAIYDRDHAVIVTLTEKDLAKVELMVARTDDLPQV
jgi:hypothetical protein